MLSRALSGQHSVHWEYVNCLQTSTNTLPLHTHYCTERYWLSRSGTNRLTRSTWVHAHIYYGWAQVLTSTCSMNSSMCILSLQHWQTQLNGYTYALYWLGRTFKMDCMYVQTDTHKNKYKNMWSTMWHKHIQILKKLSAHAQTHTKRTRAWLHSDSIHIM